MHGRKEKLYQPFLLSYGLLYAVCFESKKMSHMLQKNGAPKSLPMILYAYDPIKAMIQYKNIFGFKSAVGQFE